MFLCFGQSQYIKRLCFGVVCKPYNVYLQVQIQTYKRDDTKLLLHDVKGITLNYCSVVDSRGTDPDMIL